MQAPKRASRHGAKGERAADRGLLMRRMAQAEQRAAADAVDQKPNAQGRRGLSAMMREAEHLEREGQHEKGAWLRALIADLAEVPFK